MHVQVDITNAYLYAYLDTVIYMKQPSGYEIDYNKVYSDFATNRDDRVSMEGFITFIDKTTISWRTFKQKSVSLSAMEAEVANAAVTMYGARKKINKQKEQYVNGTENILLNGCTTTSAQNYGQKSSGRSDIDAV
ncbi:hypothetical protein TNCV_4138641 [Trichonephila clavipes]|nr:hypothetical protein TNCV_4138641 [Trichonephila clavipes]